MGIRLGDICHFQSGGTPSKNNMEYFGGDIPWITTTSLTGKKINESDAVEWITEKAIKESAAKIVPANSIMVGTRVGVGKVAINEIDMSTSQDIISLLEIDDEIWSKEYICNFLQGKKTYLNSQARGATIKGIKIDVLAELVLSEISLKEQKKISLVLETVKRLIELRQEELHNLDNLIKSRFIELFGDPEDTTTKWERTIFSSVCMDMHQGINTVADKVEYVNSGFPIIQSKNITSGYLDLEDVRYVTESDYEYYRNKYNPKPSDLLVCNIGTIGKSLIVESEVDFLIAWNLFLIKLNKELVNPIFIKMFIELLNQQNYFEKYMTGGTVKFVNKKTMGSISTPLPPMELQEQFAVFVEQTDKLKFEVKKSLDETQKLMDSLMQQFFG